MHGDAIGAYPVQLRICEPTEVPIVRGQDDGNSPEEDLICEHLRGRLSKDGSVNVRLQELLVVYDEARICHLVQQDCDVVVAPTMLPRGHAVASTWPSSIDAASQLAANRFSAVAPGTSMGTPGRSRSNPPGTLCVWSCRRNACPWKCSSSKQDKHALLQQHKARYHGSSLQPWLTGQCCVASPESEAAWARASCHCASPGTRRHQSPLA